jgi:hypothetical protein
MSANAELKGRAGLSLFIRIDAMLGALRGNVSAAAGVPAPTTGLDAARARFLADFAGSRDAQVAGLREMIRRAAPPGITLEDADLAVQGEHLVSAFTLSFEAVGLLATLRLPSPSGSALAPFQGLQEVAAGRRLEVTGPYPSMIAPGAPKPREPGEQRVDFMLDIARPRVEHDADRAEGSVLRWSQDLAAPRHPSIRVVYSSG